MNIECSERGTVDRDSEIGEIIYNYNRLEEWKMARSILRSLLPGNRTKAVAGSKIIRVR